MPQDWQNARGMAKCQEGIILADSTCFRFYLLQILLGADSTWFMRFCVPCSIPGLVLPACAALFRTAESGLEMQKLVLKEPDTCSHSNNADKSL